MVAHLLKLQLALQKAGFRRNAWAVVGLIVGLLYAFGAAVLLIVGAAFLRGHSPWLVGSLSVMIWAVITLGWCVLPLLAFGVDETLDPGRFALFSLRARELMPGLLLAGFVSTSGLLNVLCAMAFVLAWSGGITTALAALVAAVLGVLTCFLASRVLTTALASALAKRKSRDFAAVLLFVLIMSVSLGMQFVSRGVQRLDAHRMLHLFQVIGQVAAWTPFGWVWAIPWDVATHAWIPALVRLLLSVGLLAVMWFGWARYLERGMTSPLEAGEEGGKVKATSWVDRLYPATPSGAVAARSLRYWRRDTRHVIAMVSIVVTPVLLTVVSALNAQSRSQAGTGTASSIALLFTPAVLALMVGIGMSNELSYDGSALWTHISCGLRGRDDRLGRVMALLTITGPLVAVAFLAVLGFSRRWDLAPATLGVVLSLFGCAIGAGSLVGAIFIVPSPPPGQRNAFNRGQSGGIAGLLNPLATWGLTFLVSLPAIGLAVGSFWVHWLGWLSVAIGLAMGLGAAWLGVVWGGRILDRRWPQALKAATYEAH